MKRKLFFGLFIMAFLFSAQAQPIPVGNNSGFENWGGNPPEPTGWTSALKATVQISIIPVPVTASFGTRTNDAYEDEAALKVSPLRALDILPEQLQNIASGLIGQFVPGVELENIVIPGICQLGSTSRTTVALEDILALAGLDFSDLSDIAAILEQLSVLEGFMAPGVAFEGAPETVKAQVKLTSEAEEETAVIIAFSTKANGNDRDYIAMGVAMVEMSDEYQEVTINMNNLPNAAGEADRLSIVIVCGGLDASTTSALYIDEVMAEGQLEVIPGGQGVSISEKESLSYTMSPNPANDVVKVTPANTTENYTVNVFDITGKLVIAQTNLMGETVINTSALTSGVYMLEMRQGKNSRTSKLVIE